MKCTIVVTICFLLMASLYATFEGFIGFFDIMVIWAIWFILFGSDFHKRK
jgi:hypothetical protein